MKSILLIILVLEVVMCLRCRPCEPDLCPPRPLCNGGYVKGICGCCDTCAKVDGEKCGGLWNMYGKCDVGFVCAQVKRHAKGVCVSIKKISNNKENACALKPETGPCRAAIKVWYYDNKTDTCKRFIYGGCGGNANRFREKKMCQKTCYA
ncbi:venom protein 302 [Hydra vulgaris]|uniref:Venom protein 302 n=1 Tax=Hydra vulgaris TaxID=6087 RepID=A0ABM4CJD6_HYDVU